MDTKLYAVSEIKRGLTLQLTRRYKIQVAEADFLNRESLQNIPEDIEVVYYLIHSMSTQTGDFEKMEQVCAENFKERLNQTNSKTGHLS